MGQQASWISLRSEEGTRKGMESLGQDKGFREELNVSNSYHHPRNWPNPDPGCDPIFFPLIYPIAHGPHCPGYIVYSGMGTGGRERRFFIPMESVFGPSVPHGSHTGIRSLGTPAKPGEARQSESGFKGMFSSKNFQEGLGVRQGLWLRLSWPGS